MRHEIDLKIIPTTVVFISGRKKYNRYCKKNLKLNLEQYEMTLDAITLEVVQNNEHRVVLAIKKMLNHSVYEKKALIVHEITHVVNFIMKHFNLVCEEFQAYLTQFLYQEIIKKYDTQN